jgi:hypothetical protein
MRCPRVRDGASGPSAAPRERGALAEELAVLGGKTAEVDEAVAQRDLGDATRRIAAQRAPHLMQTAQLEEADGAHAVDRLERVAQRPLADARRLAEIPHVDRRVELFGDRVRGATHDALCEHRASERR